MLGVSIDLLLVQWDSVVEADFFNANIAWFCNSKLNVSANCLDRHVRSGNGDKPAVTWEMDDGQSQTFTYSQALQEVNRAANVLRALGVKKGDTVTMYMPMMPKLMFSMLACARIGAIHSVVFGGFSADSLAERIVNCGSTVVITADAGRRGGKQVPLKPVVNAAIDIAAARGVTVKHVLCTHR